MAKMVVSARYWWHIEFFLESEGACGASSDDVRAAYRTNDWYSGAYFREDHVEWLLQRLLLDAPTCCAFWERHGGRPFRDQFCDCEHVDDNEYDWCLCRIGGREAGLLPKFFTEAVQRDIRRMIDEYWKEYHRG